MTQTGWAWLARGLGRVGRRGGIRKRVRTSWGPSLERARSGAGSEEGAAPPPWDGVRSGAWRGAEPKAGGGGALVGGA